MIARIFKEHGFHTGDKKFRNQFGYRTYENLELRQSINAITHMVGSMDKRLNAGKNNQHIRRLFERHIGKTPWLFKAGPQYWSIVHGAFPTANFVLITRNIESIIASQQAKSPKLNTRLWVEAFVQAIEDLHQELQYPVIDSDEVIAGNYTSLEVAMEYCGIPFHPVIADDCIDKKMWRF